LRTARRGHIWTRRKEKYKVQTKDWYAALGQFVVQFEHVCKNMETCIIFALHGDGLRNQNLAQALLTDLTAAPLHQSFRAIVAELRKNDTEDLRILDNVSKRVEKLIEDRNEVVHRTWFVGWAAVDQEDFSTVRSWKFKKTRRGAEFKPKSYTTSALDDLSKKADELAKIISRMDGCLGIGTSFSKNFKVEKDGTVRLPEGKR
jgi:hypothetical protein